MGKFGWIAVTAGVIIAVGFVAKSAFPGFFHDMIEQIKNFFTESIKDAAKDAGKGGK